MADGWSELGAMLGGGGQLKQQAYQMGVESGTRQAGLLEQARKLRDANLAREAVTPQAIANVDTDPITGQPNAPEAQGALRAELVSSMLRAGIDPRQLSGFEKDRQGVDFRNQAMTTATAANHDDNLLNRMLMVISGKPADLTKVEGNMVLNPTMTPDSQTVAPDQLGLAEMVLRGAQSNAANAAAGEHSAHARLFDTQTAAGGFNPNTGSGTGGKPTLPPVADMAAVLGSEYDKASGTTKVPEAKVQQFLTWQSSKAAVDPRYNNGAFALRQYAAEKPVGAGMNDSPDDIGAMSLTDMLGTPSGASPAALPAAPVATPAAPAPSVPDGVAKPTSEAEYKALPPGTRYLHPDGTVRVKGSS